MPWLDWQFYVVTAVAAWGAWTLLRQLVGSREASGPPCGACASGTAACAKKPFSGTGSSPKLVVLQDRRRQAVS